MEILISVAVHAPLDLSVLFYNNDNDNHDNKNDDSNNKNNNE